MKSNRHCQGKPRTALTYKAKGDPKKKGKKQDTKQNYAEIFIYFLFNSKQVTYKLIQFLFLFFIYIFYFDTDVFLTIQGPQNLFTNSIVALNPPPFHHHSLEHSQTCL